MIVFDFDGVVADSLVICRLACIYAARRQGASLRLPDNPFSVLDPLTFSAFANLHEFEPTRFTADVGNAIALHSVAPVFAGMTDTWQALARHHEIVVLSASAERVIRRFLESHGLSELVAKVIGGDAGGTKTAWLTHLSKAQAVGTVVMVGDAASDFDAARLAGLPFVGVGWGWQSAARLRARGASLVAMAPSELPELIAQAQRVFGNIR